MIQKIIALIRAGHLARHIQVLLITIFIIALTFYAITFRHTYYEPTLCAGSIEVMAQELGEINLNQPIATYVDNAVVGASSEDNVVETEEIINSTTYNVASTFVNNDGITVKYNGKKTYERYGKITAFTAGDLQDVATTDENGFRKLDDRYMVAIGSAFGTEIGQYFDLVLENGTVIPCIMGDQKADEDTDSTCVFTSASACATEFIVDTKKISKDIKHAGDVSKLDSSWDSKVVQIIVYDKFYEGMEA